MALAAMVFAVFAQTRHFNFINFDDHDYVTDNPLVCQGLTVSGILCAFTHAYSSNWHPLTWISHMADYQLFGLNPAGHHLSNVLFHGIAAILAFFMLRDLTGRTWRSAFVAAVFAIHPLRAESVAWVAERKDLLAGVFFMATLWAYSRYARGERSWPRYLPVLACAVAGLLCKPMLVTVPFVLLLLDYWPLNRFDAACGWSGAWRLIVEKAPLFALSAAACVVTLVAQWNAIVEERFYPLSLRLANAAESILIYLRQAVYPAGLAFHYPHPTDLAQLPGAIVAAVVVVAITVAVFLLAKKQPWLVTGWLWYLGMLVPVLGFVQVGTQAHADRYTYLPQIGIYLLATWAVAELSTRLPFRRWILSAAATVFIAALMCVAHRQTAYWHDSQTLWKRSLVKTQDNYLAYCAFGTAILSDGHYPEAIACFNKALQINPRFSEAADELGNALTKMGHANEAIPLLRKVVAAAPKDATAHNYLGRALQTRRLYDEAIFHARTALKLRPSYGEAEFLLGVVYFEKGELDQSVAHCRAALRLTPNLAMCHGILADGLQAQHHTAEALAHYRRALELQPNIPKLANNAAWILATSPDAAIRNGAKAVELAEQANRAANGTDPDVISTLAAAYAETGRYSEAMVTAQKALELAGGHSKNVDEYKKQLSAYSEDKPLRDSSLTEAGLPAK